MAISPDLTRNLDPRRDPDHGQGVGSGTTTVAYNNATTTLSNIVSIDESPLIEGLIYVGTDDGILQVTEDGGKTWRKTDEVRRLPGRDLRDERPRVAARRERRVRRR